MTIATVDPIRVDRSEALSEAFRILMNSSFHHLVVTDGDRPVGILSFSDLLRVVDEVTDLCDEQRRADIDSRLEIEEVMSTDLQKLTTRATIGHAAMLLAKGTFHAVVIVEDNDALAGIVTTTDLALYLRDRLGKSGVGQGGW